MRMMCRTKLSYRHSITIHLPSKTKSHSPKLALLLGRIDITRARPGLLTWPATTTLPRSINQKQLISVQAGCAQSKTQFRFANCPPHKVIRKPKGEMWNCSVPCWQVDRWDAQNLRLVDPVARHSRVHWWTGLIPRHKCFGHPWDRQHLALDGCKTNHISAGIARQPPVSR